MMKIAFWTLIGSILALISTAVAASVLDSDLTGSNGVEIIANIATLALIISFVALWANGVMKLWKNWANRPTSLNMILTVFLIFGSLMAAFFFYFYENE